MTEFILALLRRPELAGPSVRPCKSAQSPTESRSTGREMEHAPGAKFDTTQFGAESVRVLYMTSLIQYNSFQLADLLAGHT